MYPLLIAVGIIALVFLSGVRIVFEYKRALKFRFGEFVKTLEPGLRWVIPLIESVQFVDVRVITINILSQEVMTR